jgi:hypothetical protein
MLLPSLAWIGVGFADCFLSEKRRIGQIAFVFSRRIGKIDRASVNEEEN